jgi:hypothetical protein
MDNQTIQGPMARVLSAKPETVYIDKYSGAEFTAKEIADLALCMLLTEASFSKEEIDRFCERFEPLANKRNQQ